MTPPAPWVKNHRLDVLVDELYKNSQLSLYLCFDVLISGDLSSCDNLMCTFTAHPPSISQPFTTNYRLAMASGTSTTKSTDPKTRENETTDSSPSAKNRKTSSVPLLDRQQYGLGAGYIDTMAHNSKEGIVLPRKDIFDIMALPQEVRDMIHEKALEDLTMLASHRHSGRIRAYRSESCVKNPLHRLNYTRYNLGFPPSAMISKQLLKETLDIIHRRWFFIRYDIWHPSRQWRFLNPCDACNLEISNLELNLVEIRSLTQRGHVDRPSTSRVPHVALFSPEHYHAHLPLSVRSLVINVDLLDARAHSTRIQTTSGFAILLDLPEDFTVQFEPANLGMITPHLSHVRFEVTCYWYPFPLSFLSAVAERLRQTAVTMLVGEGIESTVQPPELGCAYRACVEATSQEYRRRRT